MPRPSKSPRDLAPVEPRYASLEDAALYIGAKTPRTIRRAIADGRLTGYRFGPRIIRVDLAELDALMRPIPAADETTLGTSRATA